MQIQIVTYIYPNAMAYLSQLAKSIRDQTLNNFGLILFNDGVDAPEQYFNDLNIPVKVVAASGSPLEIRFSSLETLRTDEASFFIFQDADDQMSQNRVEVVCQKLSKYDLVVNDLNLIDENGNLTEAHVW